MDLSLRLTEGLHYAIVQIILNILPRPRGGDLHLLGGVLSHVHLHVETGQEVRWAQLNTGHWTQCQNTEAFLTLPTSDFHFTALSSFATQYGSILTGEVFPTDNATKRP